MTKGSKPRSSSVKGDKGSKWQSRALATETTVPGKLKPKVPWCPLCNKNIHLLEDCDSYNQKGYDELRHFVVKKGLCFGCLRKGHLSSECRSRLTCKHCSKKHPSSLHKSNNGEVKAVTAQGTSLNPNSSHCGKSTSIVHVLVSHVQNPHQERLVYAMLDSQSDTTFVLELTRKALNIPVVPTTLLLSTMSRMSEILASNRVNGLQIRGLNSDKVITLPPLYTRDVMPVSLDHIPTPETAKEWPHLHGLINELSPRCDCEVGLLIGYNCPQALAPREVITHPENQGPYGQRTDLGWSIIGVTSPTTFEDDAIGISHHILARKTASTADMGNSVIITKTKIKEVFAPGRPLDLINILEQDFQDKPGPFNSENYSQDDLAFVNLMSKEIVSTSDGHYEMPLPLKSDKLPLSPNRHMAFNCLKSLKRKFEKDPNYHKAYALVVQDLLDKGYAQPAGENKIAWYLPHHGVRHPHKQGKVRVIFDASSRYEGKCLNDILMQGPDLANNLTGVLCRFRREPVAVTCDIEAMFHQFRVPHKHRDFLRFLRWPQGDLLQEAKEYCMSVHLFGATSSPSCANFGLKQLAADHGIIFWEAASEFLRRNFYVDDGLASQPTVEDAVDLINNTREMCGLGGLLLHKILSNSKEVMSHIGEEDQSLAANQSGKVLDHSLLSGSIERVLGVCLHVANDSLGFKITLSDQPLSCRGVLSTVASVYDPLGLASPVLLKGKQILQEICKENLDWDAPLPDHVIPRWKKWRHDLMGLNDIQVPQCFKPTDFGKVRRAELHHFADASLNGYGVCTYLRQISMDGRIHCSLVMGKERVVPLKSVTVPKLELSAATTAARLSKYLKRELDVNATNRYWTDSKAVLGYLSNEVKRNQIFVANRVQEIRDTTKVDEWQHISTDQNPADIASRGCSAQELLNSKWFSGPDLLWEEVIPENKPSTRNSTEVNSCALATNATVSESVLCSIFHKPWLTMKRIASICVNIKEIMLGKIKVLDIDASHLRTAETILIQQVQKTCFRQELQDLKQHGSVKAASTLSKLDPFVDSDGLLRVGGRLKNSTLSYVMKHLVLLPKGHDLSRSVLTHFHEATAHQSGKRAVVEARSNGLWVIGAARLVRSISNKCVQCRKLKRRADKQKMADLPRDSLEAVPPFTYSGVDFFGPFVINEGRKELKRWGCLFTCLCSRAIHLEVAISLSSSDFINALRHLNSLRGNVLRLRCDRGTNFVGASNELKRALDEVQSNKVRRYLAGHNCKYIFITPHSSHMGGVWERCIRTVRSVLSALLKDQGVQLDDDSLRTLFAETAAIVNSSPLSIENQNDPSAPVPITPNHLLTLRNISGRSPTS